MTTTLLLVRHGATAANLQQPYTLQGSQPDNELAPVGFAQAHACAAALAAYPLAAVCSSPLLRARDTAAQIAVWRGIPLELDPRLIEIDVGVWAGLTWQEIEHRWPREAAAFHDDAEQCGYLGGENLQQLRDRVLPCIDDLVNRHLGSTFAVVSHGVVNRVLLATWLGIPLRFARRLPQDNAAYNVIELRDGQAKVRTINRAAYLERAA